MATIVVKEYIKKRNTQEFGDVLSVALGLAATQNIRIRRFYIEKCTIPDLDGWDIKIEGSII